MISVEFISAFTMMFLCSVSWAGDRAILSAVCSLGLFRMV